MNKIFAIAIIAVSGTALGAVYYSRDDKQAADAPAVEAARPAPATKASADNGCPDGGPNAPKTTLRIRYREYFADSDAPPTEVETVIRDDYRWRHSRFSVTARGMTMEEQTRRMEELADLGDELGIFSGDGPIPPDKMAVYREARAQLQADIEASKNQLNDVGSERIQVIAPPPAWSYEFDVNSRVGQRERKTDARRIAAEILAAHRAEPKVLDVLRDVDVNQASNAGSRQVAGYECQVVQMTSPFTADICQRKFGEQEVVLYSRWSRGDSGLIKEAVSVEEGICVPLAKFSMPVDVDWGEDE